MRSMKTILVATAAVALAAGPAMAHGHKGGSKGGHEGSGSAGFDLTNSLDEITVTEKHDDVTHNNVGEVLNKIQLEQSTSGDISAWTKLDVVGVEDASGTAVAIGNSINADTDDNLAVMSDQGNWGDKVEAGLKANVHDVEGVVELTSVAIGNSLSASAGGAVADISQSNDADVSASLNAMVTGAPDEVTTTAVAIGNSASMTASGAAVTASIDQWNGGDVSAYNRTQVYTSQNGYDPASAVAIGNTISIVNNATQ